RKHDEAITILTREYLLKDIFMYDDSIEILYLFSKLYRLYYNVELTDFNRVFENIGYSDEDSFAYCLQFKDDYNDEEFINLIRDFGIIVSSYSGFKQLMLDDFEINDSYKDLD